MSTLCPLQVVLNLTFCWSLGLVRHPCRASLSCLSVSPLMSLLLLSFFLCVPSSIPSATVPNRHVLSIPSIHPLQFAAHPFLPLSPCQFSIFYQHPSKHLSNLPVASYPIHPDACTQHPCISHSACWHPFLSVDGNKRNQHKLHETDITSKNKQPRCQCEFHWACCRIENHRKGG